MIFQDCWGLFGSAALVSAAVFSVPWLKRWNSRRYWPAGLLLVVLLLPLIHGLSLAGFLRGVIGDLSVTTLVLVLISFFVPSEPLSEPVRRLLILVLAGGLVLYTFSLGPFRIDPYEWGYQPRMMLLVLAVAGFLSARRHPTLLYYLAVPLLAYFLRMSASVNLWDYLIDPLVFGYAFCVILIVPALRLRKTS